MNGCPCREAGQDPAYQRSDPSEVRVLALSLPRGTSCLRRSRSLVQKKYTAARRVCVIMATMEVRTFVDTAARYLLLALIAFIMIAMPSCNTPGYGQSPSYGCAQAQPPQQYYVQNGHRPPHYRQSNRCQTPTQYAAPQCGNQGGQQIVTGEPHHYCEKPEVRGPACYPGTKQSNWKLGSVTHQRWYWNPKTGKAEPVGPATDYNPEDPKLHELMEHSGVKDDFPREIPLGGAPVVHEHEGRRFADRDLTRPSGSN